MSYYEISTGFFPVPIKACFSIKEFNKILKDNGLLNLVKLETQPLERGIAETHYFGTDSGHITLVIVIFDLEEISNNVVKLAGTVAHESVHVVERVLEYVGENKNEFGEESRAYLLQSIVEQMFDAACKELMRDEERAQRREQAQEKSRGQGGTVLEVDKPKHDGGAGPDSDVQGHPSGGTKRPRGKTVKKAGASNSDAAKAWH